MGVSFSRHVVRQRICVEEPTVSCSSGVSLNNSSPESLRNDYREGLGRDAYGTGQAGLSVEGLWLTRITNQEMGTPLGATWWSQIRKNCIAFWR